MKRYLHMLFCLLTCLSLFLISCEQFRASLSVPRESLNAEPTFNEPTNITLQLSSNNIDENTSYTLSFDIEQGNLELYQAVLTFPGTFTFNGFLSLGDPGTQIGSFSMDWNIPPDNVGDYMMQLYSIDDNTAYADIDLDGEYSSDIDPQMVYSHTGNNHVFTSILPYGGDGNPQNLVGYGPMRLIVVLFSGILTNPASIGTYTATGSFTSVDPDTDDADDGSGEDPITLNFSRDIAIIGTDTDGDGVTDSEDDNPNDSTIATPDSGTGTGKITVDTSNNTGTTLTETQTFSDTDPGLDQTNKPTDYEFKDGLVTFKINGVPVGGTVQVKITFPTAIPEGAKYYKVDENGFYEFSGATISGNTVTLSLTDGGDGDKDGLANGVIDDPGGVAAPVSAVDTTAPSVPTGLIATAASSSQIDLSWDASTDNVGVTGYNVYRDGTSLMSVTVTSASDTGLSAGTQYCYTVSAYDSAGNESAQSTQVCETTSSEDAGGTGGGDGGTCFIEAMSH